MSNWREPRDADSGPIDVGAVGRDDTFIDDLAAGRPTPVADDVEYDLAVMITAWRSDALSAPIPAEPTLAQIDDAMKVREGRGSLSRRLRIVSGAAAIMAVLGAGLMVLSEGAEPGDPLWAVKQVVFSEQAEQTQARVNVEDNLRAAEAAFRAGDEDKARELISKAESDLGPVNDKDMASKLRDQINDLRVSVPNLPTVSVQTSPSDRPDDPSDTTKPGEPSDTDDPHSPTTSPTKPPTSSSKPSSSTQPSKPPTRTSVPSFTFTIPIPIG
ncbi:anti-sigma-D factor RsdA [Gordonia sp. (in: high G+C Gram-positive bacteria)]|uniref:anti-sigma-D factor RsdA n=1 Tax=Gordonia sp. (in: high G+C Gram-positive bacteria) TaxID=84139 RepID=UPI0033400092